MPIIRDYGKDKVILVTKEDHATPSTVKLPPSEHPVTPSTKDDVLNMGYLYPNGSETGPCALQLREALSCYKDATYECQNAFLNMQKCLLQNPLVPEKPDDADATNNEDLQDDEVDSNKAAD